MEVEGTRWRSKGRDGDGRYRKAHPSRAARRDSGCRHGPPHFPDGTLYRRWHLHWGATPAEIAEVLPGDALIPDAQFKATRAISIDAPPGAVWPWLVQVGCLRAGFYSNDLLDNLAHPSATTIVPSLQHLEFGQWVSIADAHRGHGVQGSFLVVYVPARIDCVQKPLTAVIVDERPSYLVEVAKPWGDDVLVIVAPAFRVRSTQYAFDECPGRCIGEDHRVRPGSCLFG